MMLAHYDHGPPAICLAILNSVCRTQDCTE